MTGLLAGALCFLGSCGQARNANPARATGVGAHSRASAPAGATHVEEFLSQLPRTPPQPLDENVALFLAALPLSCIDRPQTLTPAATRARYLYQIDVKPIPELTKRRAFYGCYDWHSAVNSTWALVALLKRFPHLPAASLIREKLNAHLGKSNLQGELQFFQKAKSFERPYGRSWLLKLYAALLRWNDADAKKWAANMAPLATFFASNLREYMKTLPYPTRTGVHPNTAFSMNLLLDYADASDDRQMRRAVAQTAMRFFAGDTGCPTAYEPEAAEFISPCLEEAKLMSRVMPRKSFLPWFDRFLPAVYSAKFRPLWRAFNVSGIHQPDELAGKSHLIGLAFERAEAMVRIADILPPSDPRAKAYRRLAAINAAGGMKNLEGAGYLGSHWLGTYALGYLLAASSPSGLPVTVATGAKPRAVVQ